MAAILARSQGVSYQELLKQDVVAPPTTLTLENPYGGGSTAVPVSRYATQEFHDLEMEKLWPKVWQMACREEEIPEVGSYTLYEIGKFSIVVVRTSEGIRAHHNVCRHRGRRLCDHAGHAPSFICPFHGFSWNLDGSLRGVTSEWDFPHIDQENLTLSPVQCDTWGGWVFINMDMSAAPLAEHLGDLPAHFEVWEPENRYIEAHVAKVMGCNWKACQEAFMEAFHVVKTHPQILVGIGDENSQYDVWANLSRAITPNGTPSPHLNFGPDEQELFDSVTMRFLDRPSLGEVPEGTTARAMMAAGARMGMQSIVGYRCNSEARSRSMTNWRACSDAPPAGPVAREPVSEGRKIIAAPGSTEAPAVDDAAASPRSSSHCRREASRRSASSSRCWRSRARASAARPLDGSI